MSTSGIGNSTKGAQNTNDQASTADTVATETSKTNTAKNRTIKDSFGFVPCASGSIAGVGALATDLATGIAQGNRTVHQDPPAHTNSSANQVLRQRFYAANPQAVDQPFLADAKFAATQPGQAWGDIIDDHYGKLFGEMVPPATKPSLPADTRAMLIQATALLSGRSSLEAPPDLVALPDLRDLSVLLGALQREQAGKPIMPTRAARASGATITAMPAAGHNYEARWSDNLRGVVLQAYPEMFAGKDAQQADQLLRCLMIAVALKNDLHEVDLREAGIIHLPSVEEMEAFTLGLQESDVAHLEKQAPRLLHGIHLVGVDAQQDLARLRQLQNTPASSNEQLAELIPEVSAHLTRLRYQRVFSSAAVAAPFGVNCGLFTEFTETTPLELALLLEFSSDSATVELMELSRAQREWAHSHPLEFRLQVGGFVKPDGSLDQARLADAQRKLGEDLAAVGIIVRPGDTMKQVMQQVEQADNVSPELRELIRTMSDVVLYAEKSGRSHEEKLLEGLINAEQVATPDSESGFTFDIDAGAAAAAGDQQEADAALYEGHRAAQKLGAELAAARARDDELIQATRKSTQMFTREILDGIHEFDRLVANGRRIGGPGSSVRKHPTR